MDSVLVIVGLAGATSVVDAASVFGPPPPEIHDEIAAVVRGLRARGVRALRIAAPFALEVSGVETVRSGLAPALFDRVDAVVWIGAAAAAGTQGFAAHTLSLHASWHSGERELGEWDLACGLAAERGAAVLFASGDDVLAGGVITKHARSRAVATARPLAEVLADLERTARTAAPVAAPACPPRLELRFKRRWQAAEAARAGATRVAPHAVVVEGASFGDAFQRGVAAVAASASRLRAALASEVELARALREPLPAATPSPRDVEAARALAALLAMTDGAATWQRAQRALILHALSRHAPAFFARSNLGAVLDAAVRVLAEVPARLDGLDAMEALARLEACYVRSERGGSGVVDGASLERCVPLVALEQPLVAWMLSELGAQLGVPRALAETATTPPRSWLSHVHWSAHEIVFETRYLQRALPPRGWETRVEALAARAQTAIDERHAGAAAEIALALQIGGEARATVHDDLVAFLAARQVESGAVVDPRAAGRDGAAESIARTTGHALLVFAHATEAITP